MHELIRQIAKDISNDLPKKPNFLEEFTHSISKIDSSDVNEQRTGLHFLLKTACEYNLIEKLHALLELNVLDDINRPLEYTSPTQNGSGLTLLGIAAFNGHQEMVRYLIDVQGADKKGRDLLGNTPLHQVIYGDSHPYNHYSIGSNHNLVAEDLVFKYNVNINIKNASGSSARSECLRVQPWKIERLVAGKRLIRTSSSPYYADKVRPVIEKKQIQLDQISYLRGWRKTKVRVVTLEPPVRKKQDFEQFRTDFALEAYIKRGQITMRFQNAEDIITAILSRTLVELEHALGIIQTVKPEPNAGFQLPNEHDIRFIILMSVFITALTQYLVDNLPLSLVVGVFIIIGTTSKCVNDRIKEQSQKDTTEMSRVSELHSLFPVIGRKISPAYLMRCPRDNNDIPLPDTSAPCFKI